MFKRHLSANAAAVVLVASLSALAKAQTTYDGVLQYNASTGAVSECAGGLDYNNKPVYGCQNLLTLELGNHGANYSVYDSEG